MWAYGVGLLPRGSTGWRVLVERQWAAEHCRGTHLAQSRTSGGCYVPSLARTAESSGDGGNVCFVHLAAVGSSSFPHAAVVV